MSHGEAALPTPSALVTAPTSRETVLGLLDGQRRKGPPIRSAFLQERAGKREPGPLRDFVVERRLFALLPAGAWARALGLTSQSAESTVSRNWRWLKDKKLVRTQRHKRVVDAYLLCEDGSGDEYTRSRDYFKLPLAFFREGWHEKLSLPATATLLISLNSQRKGESFELRISADTLQRGLDELRDALLVAIRTESKRDVRTRYGVVSVNGYRLLGDFARASAPPKAIDAVER